jgi:hypothetical protein
LYIAQDGVPKIRKVDTSGHIITFAGTGNVGYSGDGGPAIDAEVDEITGMAVDQYDNLYLTDYSNKRIRKIDAITGIITTVAGNGGSGFNGDGIPATTATLAGPFGSCVDLQGNILIAVPSQERVRIINTAGIISTLAGTGVAGFSGDGGSPDTAKLHFPHNVKVDTCGNVYIADQSNNRVRKIVYPGCSLSIKNTVPSQLNIYTDLSGDFFTIDNQQLKGRYLLFSISGSLVSINTLKSDKTVVSMKSLPTGIYILRIITEAGEIIARKIGK